ncbi:hypothetical protein PT2222_140358 [Paraburkholderia tropica]
MQLSFSFLKLFTQKRGYPQNDNFRDDLFFINF